jgi:hypothetical protein
MSEVVTDYRLAEARSRRERLEEDARGTAEENARIRRHLDAVRAAEASAAAAARGTRDRFEDPLEDLGTRLAIPQLRPAAELVDDRHLFERAVEAELHDWDTEGACRRNLFCCRSWRRRPLVFRRPPVLIPHGRSAARPHPKSAANRDLLRRFGR